MENGKGGKDEGGGSILDVCSLVDAQKQVQVPKLWLSCSLLFPLSPLFKPSEPIFSYFIAKSILLNKIIFSITYAKKKYFVAYFIQLLANNVPKVKYLYLVQKKIKADYFKKN